MFATSSGRLSPSDRRMLAVTATLGAAIALAVTIVGPLDTAIDRAPYGLLGGVAYAVGGVLGLAIRRWRSR
jgi:hypothetical protein